MASPSLQRATEVALDQLDRQLGAEPKGQKEERWILCPNCGAEADREKCSYGPRGWHCFLCIEGGSLWDLMDRLKTPKVEGPFRAPKKRKETKRQPFDWQKHSSEILNGFENAPNLEERWNEYRPFTLETIRRWNLGLGVLPSCRCHHPRLIYPAFNALGEIVAFRGRAIECDCVKWIQSAGSKVTLWGGSLIGYQQRQTVIIGESPIDVMLAMQMTPGIVGVATTGGAGNWRHEWSAHLAYMEPGQCVVWYDNDLPGTPCQERIPELAAMWREKHPKAKKLPKPNGPPIANELLDLHAPTSLYHWPVTAPLKADLSWALVNGWTGVG